MPSAPKGSFSAPESFSARLAAELKSPAPDNPTTQRLAASCATVVLARNAQLKGCQGMSSSKSACCVPTFLSVPPKPSNRSSNFWWTPLRPWSVCQGVRFGLCHLRAVRRAKGECAKRGNFPNDDIVLMTSMGPLFFVGPPVDLQGGEGILRLPFQTNSRRRTHEPWSLGCLKTMACLSTCSCYVYSWFQKVDMPFGSLGQAGSVAKEKQESRQSVCLKIGEIQSCRGFPLAFP